MNDLVTTPRWERGYLQLGPDLIVPNVVEPAVPNSSLRDKPDAVASDNAVASEKST